MSEFDNRNTYVLNSDDKISELRIADEVIASIAAIAATDVEGVSTVSGNITRDNVNKVGNKALSKGVKVVVEGNNANIDMVLMVDYGCSIPKVTSKVQEKVKSTIESMTGLNITDVNIRVAGVNIDNKKL
ncbi:MAG: Asp23/Gls24 family envelope stress response protein [Lachnospiraceae bacterium]|nr:Asp23/Gls24 family envelope stress response protein [Lachnospiraceae bacterium]